MFCLLAVLLVGMVIGAVVTTKLTPVFRRPQVAKPVLLVPEFVREAFSRARLDPACITSVGLHDYLVKMLANARDEGSAKGRKESLAMLGNLLNSIYFAAKEAQTASFAHELLQEFETTVGVAPHAPAPFRFNEAAYLSEGRFAVAEKIQDGGMVEVSYPAWLLNGKLLLKGGLARARTNV